MDIPLLSPASILLLVAFYLVTEKFFNLDNDALEIPRESLAHRIIRTIKNRLNRQR